MRLLLIRHGRTTSNVGGLLDTAVPGADLDEVGLEQALALVDRLSEHHLDAIVVSDLVRTQQTAAPLASARGLTPVVHGGIREIQAGDYEMSPEWSGYVTTLLSWREDLSRRMPGGETGEEVLTRFDDVVRLLHADGHGSVAIVTHGAVMGMWTIARAHNVDLEFFGTVSRDNTVIVELVGEPDTGWQLVRWGDETPPERDTRS